MNRYPNNNYGVSEFSAGWLTIRVAAVSAIMAMIASGVGCNTVSPDTPAGLGSAAPAADLAFAASEAERVARDIEEADIVKIAGSKLYALNMYKGLLIIDVTNADAPSLLGRLDLRGRGVEMYVVGSRACVLLSADCFYYGAYAVEPGGSASSRPIPPVPDFQGSQLAIIDVSDPAAPVLNSKLDLAGFASESRRVGDIIYVVGSNYIPFDYVPANDEEVNDGFVASVSVADPANIVPVERKTFSGAALAIHVSDSALFAASQDYDPDAGQGFTHVQMADISDPAGAIVLRGTLDAPGRIQNRFFMDDYQDVFRIVTESWGFGLHAVKLFTYSLADPNHIAALGNVQIIQDESLRAVRFDGPRGYAVTYFQVDPLFVLDLRDPANPAVSGHLEAPGFSTYLEPRGDRLIAVGIDDADGRRPALAYYNVADPANPAQLSRVVLGPPGSFTDSEAVYDEKAFKVIDAMGLIAIPFRHVDASSAPMPVGGESSVDAALPKCENAVQLVDFSDTALTQRGYFEHRGSVQRVGAIDDRIFALSQLSFQTVSISDRDNPVKVGQVDFLSDDEAPWWSDCGGYFIWNDWPNDCGWNWCGITGCLPAAMLPGCLLLMKQRQSAGRRRPRR